jgi:hypothetical protein
VRRRICPVERGNDFFQARGSGLERFAWHNVPYKSR